MNKIVEFDIIDILLYASAPYTGKNEIDEFKSADEKIRLTEKSRKRIQKRLQQERVYKERHEKYSPVREVLKRAAVIILVVLSMSFALVMSVEAVRVAIWETFIEWGEESLHIWRENIGDSIGGLERIMVYREPRGLGQEYVRYEGLKNEYTYTVEYESSDHLIAYNQRLITHNSVYTSNEETEVCEVQIHGMNGIMTEYEVQGVVTRVLTWTDNDYVYCLTSNVDVDALVEIAESVE